MSGDPNDRRTLTPVIQLIRAGSGLPLGKRLMIPWAADEAKSELGGAI